MNKIYCLIALLIFAAFPVQAETVTISAGTTATVTQTATVGEKAPDFILTDTHGKTHSLNEYQGQTVILEWTNHQCPFVEKHYSTGNMQALQKEAIDNGAVWLTINSSGPGKQGYTTAEEANAIIAETEAMATARLLDPESTVGRLYEAKATPHMYVINSEGTLVYAGAIDDNPSSDPATVETANNYVRNALASLTAGEPVDPAETQAYGCAMKFAD